MLPFDSLLLSIYISTFLGYVYMDISKGVFVLVFNFDFAC